MDLTDIPPSYPSDTFVADIDGRKARNLRAFYQAVARKLLFPDYFGGTLDALFDCLCSLEVIGKPSVVLHISHFDSFLDREKPEKRQAALDVLADAEKDENRYDGVRFRVVCTK
jgi:RNAse (barnase) inhibitor barstar